MDLIQIASRFADGLLHVDSSTNTVTLNRKKEPYLQGVPSMLEDAITKEFSEWWMHSYPEDFEPRGSLTTQFPYPTLSRARCDLVFSTDGTSQPPEWAVEIKRIQQVGDNGKNNDFGVTKMLSPYLKDRSLKHDVLRARAHGFARRHAVMGYGFSYGPDTLLETARHHPSRREHLDNIGAVLRVNDPIGLQLDTRELVDAVDTIFQAQDLVKADLVVVPFTGLNRHPCGGRGLVFAWEVNLD
jgi:hypothetical protein